MKTRMIHHGRGRGMLAIALAAAVSLIAGANALATDYYSRHHHGYSHHGHKGGGLHLHGGSYGFKFHYSTPHHYYHSRPYSHHYHSHSPLQRYYHIPTPDVYQHHHSTILYPKVYITPGYRNPYCY